MSSDQHRLLILGAHPDDSEFYAGGLVTIYRRLGRQVKMVSISDGSAGHHLLSGDELAALRHTEASRAGQVIGCDFESFGFPDGMLQPTLELRLRIIKEIREFKPNLILTHRTNDYHPDHRAVGQAVQDASYVVTVPAILPEVTALRSCPVIACMADTFTRPLPMHADEIVDISDCVEEIVSMLSCHVSQVFEWLPYQEGILNTVPESGSERIAWLRAWYTRHICRRAEHFRGDLQRVFGAHRKDQIRFVEVFEISEYGSTPDNRTRRELFPQAATSVTNEPADRRYVLDSRHELLGSHNPPEHIVNASQSAVNGR